jgi:Putative Ig domain
MTASGKSCKLGLLLGLAFLPSLLFGQGHIDTVTGASPNGPVTGVTLNSPLGNGFTLTLKGTFNPELVNVVHWFNTSTNTDTTFSSDGQLDLIEADQITLTIPPYLFSGSTASTQTVQVFETEGFSAPIDSNHVNFYINAPLTVNNTDLPSGTVGVPYTSPAIETGGTGPYSVTLAYGSLPLGLALNNNLTVSGTPTEAGDFFFEASVTDAWGNLDPYSYHYLTTYPMPVIITPLSPPSAAAGSLGVSVMISGTGFVVPVTGEGVTPGSTVTWSTGGTPIELPATVVSTTLIQATIPGGLLTTPVTAVIRVVQPNGAPSNAAPFTVSAPVISSLTPPGAIAGGNAFTLTVNGAYFLHESQASSFSQIVWGSTPLTTTFVNGNTLTAPIPASLIATAGSVPIHVTNPGGIPSNSVNFSIVPPIPPLQISTTSLPQGTVNVPYSAGVTASGGTPAYQFSVVGGNLPPGLTMSSSGGIGGTPTQAGQFRFTAQVTDSAGATTSAGLTITVVPPPLTLNGTIGDLALGTAVNAKFSATGGVPPYSFSAAGALPSGTTFSNAAITGTANTVGTFLFTISVADSTGTVVSKSFTVKVTVGPLSVAGSLGDGQVGVAYTGQISGSGGIAPYSFTATGLPPGVTLSTGGAAGGTPTTVGAYTVTVTATDSVGSHASQTFNVTIASAPLSITTASLGNGAVGVPYSAGLAATGGAPPYSWSFSGLPDGLSGSAGGSVSGTPTAVGTFQVGATVSDSKGAKASQSYTVVITIAPLTITTGSLPSATVGVAVSGSVSATGGTPPYQWSASGLPAGVSLSSAGGLSGTPTAPGTASVSVTVTDSKGAKASATLSMAVTLPASPTVSFNGLPATSSPGAQPTVSVGLGGTFPVDVTVQLTMTFAPDSGPDDPAVQFSTGGRTAQQVIPAGSTVSPTNVGVQTGTVAGLITITANLTAAGQNITGTPVPTWTIRVNATPPVISTATAARNSSGFTVTVIGFASSREITQAVFQFTASAGTTLQTTSVTVPVDTLFSQWYQSAASAPFGSQFTYTQPFTVSGGAQSIVSVSVTLVSKAGTSNVVSATLQ